MRPVFLQGWRLQAPGRLRTLAATARPLRCAFGRDARRNGAIAARSSHA